MYEALLGGVIFSLPGQKKHVAGGASGGRGFAKSVGLFARSAAMMTQWPVK
jgi:hypothetical protein